MQCPQCGELVDQGAAFCGNCGAALHEAVTAPVSPALSTPVDPLTASITAPTPAQPQSNQAISAQSAPSQPAGTAQAYPVDTTSGVAMPAGATPLPTYAVADPNAHRAEGRAMTALILSILSVPASVVPFAGWTLAVIGLVMATSIRSKMVHKSMSNVAIGFSVGAILLSSGVFIYNIQQFNNKRIASLDSASTTDDSSISATGTQSDDAANSNVASTVAANGALVDTPCYTMHLSSSISKPAGGLDTGCSTQAYNGESLILSTNVLNVEAITQDKIDAATLESAGKEIAGSYVTTSIPGMAITSQSMGTFAGSPAYIVQGKSDGVSVEFALVLHKVAHGENVFVITHAINSVNADISQFESTWVWK
jgi:hypothetical protein